MQLALNSTHASTFTRIHNMHMSIINFYFTLLRVVMLSALMLVIQLTTATMVSYKLQLYYNIIILATHIREITFINIINSSQPTIQGNNFTRSV